MTPSVSILVPVYNAASTLKFALSSVSQQTHGDFECVLVDDGSTDDSCEMLLAHGARDSRFRVLRLPHGGIVEALNHGLMQCRGRYVARFDADDWMHPERLRLQFERLETDARLSGVGCHVELFPREQLREGRLNYERWLNSLVTEEDIYRDRFVECPLAHPTFFFRREVMTQYGYLEQPWAEDYDLLLRLLGDGHRIGTVDTCLVRWQDSGKRLSRVSERYSLPRFFECKAHYLARDRLAGDEPYWLWGYGDTGKMLARALRRLGKVPEYIVELHAGRIGQRIAGAKVISPEQLAEVEGPRRTLIISVAGGGPRGDARRIAQGLGLREGVDYCCVA